MVSAIISSYKRPWNLDKLIPYLKEYKFISEIIILHGHKDYVNYINDCINIDDWENNKKLYTLCRFNAVSLASNDTVLLNDDDRLPSKPLFYKMLDNHLKDDNSFCGPLKRKCDCNGYVSNSKIPESNIVLPNISISSKKVYSEVFEKMKSSKYTELFDRVIKQKGNCEDIFFNKVYTDIYRQNPTIVRYKPLGNKMIINLDMSGGFQQEEDHYDQRGQFCKDFFT
tara:strand:+ start:347 stop:1024 length:678 start_codon:yes stop_codon:yes gene_type:complete